MCNYLIYFVSLILYFNFMGYLNQNGNSIGSLLRFIQEQKSQSPINPQSSEVGSPIRDVVQEPLSGSEGKGTSKVVSLRPEGTLTPSGQEANDATPQSSRIGPISIGGQGDVTQTPTNIVAANEPGPGFGIPSASKTVGDVMNRTSATGPGLGTKIQPMTRVGNVVENTERGQQVGNFSLQKDKADADYNFIKESIDRGQRSNSEVIADMNADIANTEQGLSQTEKEMLDVDARGMKKLNTAGSTENLRMLAGVRQKIEAAAAKKAANPNYLYTEFGLPTPTPTPSPTQGQSGGGSGGSSGGGQVKGISTSIKPALSYSTPQKQNITYSQAPAVNINQAVKSGGLSQPVKASPSKPSIGTTIMNAFKKLFGR